MYGIVANVSISQLFIAGIIPGILMSVALIILIYFAAKKYGYGLEDKKNLGRLKLSSAFNEAKWGLLVPIIILGGIYSGIFTPTESAVIACDYGLIVVCLFIKKLS
jgi:C4-dicarboxylate transporter DctM subunit